MSEYQTDDSSSARFARLENLGADGESSRCFRCDAERNFDCRNDLRNLRRRDVCGNGAGFSRLDFLVGRRAFVPLRLLANPYDGMVAMARRIASPVGELFNEVPDRASDGATLIGFGYAAGSNPLLGFIAAIFAIFLAYFARKEKSRARVRNLRADGETTTHGSGDNRGGCLCDSSLHPGPRPATAATASHRGCCG